MYEETEIKTFPQLLHLIVHRMSWFTEAGRDNAHRIIEKFSPAHDETMESSERDPVEDVPSSSPSSPQGESETLETVDPSESPAEKVESDVEERQDLLGNDG